MRSMGKVNAIIKKVGSKTAEDLPKRREKLSHARWLSAKKISKGVKFGHAGPCKNRDWGGVNLL